jgi:hypothetical protein
VYVYVCICLEGGRKSLGTRKNKGTLQIGDIRRVADLYLLGVLKDGHLRLRETIIHFSNGTRLLVI